MSVTNYKPKTENGCRYSYNKLRNVVYLVSKNHVKDVIIDNGEAYISGLTETPMRIEGFNIQLKETSSLDERYKFEKTVTFSVHGYVPHTYFNDKYYVIVESNDGSHWMVNVDFPSRVTYTFNLSKDVYETDFTFSSLSNFPTLRLTSNLTQTQTQCKDYQLSSGIKSLQLLEKDYCSLDVDDETIYTYGESFKDVEYLGDSCKLQEVFDGKKVTTTLEFNIAFDAYKSSWHYNLLEFLQNLYSSIIRINGSDKAFLSGFNYGLQPSFSIATSTQDGESDIITVTLVESSIQGSVVADNLVIHDDSSKNWIYVDRVGSIIAYECIGNGIAKYLLQQEVNLNGIPTGRYKALSGYESMFPTLNIIGTFNDIVTFHNSNCGGSICGVNTDLPITITYDVATCYTYSYSASCDWNVTGLADYMTVTPSNGLAGQQYTLQVCNTKVPTRNENSTFTITAGDNPRIVNIFLLGDKGVIRPSTAIINCLQQNVVFTFNSSCPITITSIDSSLGYHLTNSQLVVSVPRNYSVESGITWSIGVQNCLGLTDTVQIIQDKTYERWVDTSGYICDGRTSYVKQERYTGTTSASTTTLTGENRKGSKIEDEDARCGAVISRWVWDGNYTCVDEDKYKLEEQEITYDGGTSWVKNGVTRIGDFVESASSYCQQELEYQWVITENWVCLAIETPKWLATYSGGTTSSAECDASSAITSGEVTTTDLVSIQISNCVSSIGDDAFYWCDSLISVTIPNTVSSIGDAAFLNCRSLTSITIPSGVTEIGVTTFASCTGLTSIDIPDSVTSIGISAFRSCSGLTSVTIGSGIQDISPSAFYRCVSLQSITINAVTPPELGRSVFDGTDISAIYVPSASVNSYKSADGWSSYANIIRAIP